MLNEEDKGPAQQQAELQPVENDESTTLSGVACPLAPRDTEIELSLILDKLLGRKGAGKQALRQGQVAETNWAYIKDQPLINELRTPGFFTMAFPTVFINGSCDYTTPKLVAIDYQEFVEHIYYTGDGRVSKHPYLKFLLLNLGLRLKALNHA